MKSYGAGLPLALAFALIGCARDSSAPDEIVETSDAATSSASQTDARNTTTQPDASEASTPDADDAGVDQSADDADVPPGPAEGSACTDSAPAASVTVGDATVTKVKIAGGGNSADVEPGAAVTLSASFSLAASSCLAVDLPVLELRAGFAEGATQCSDSVACLNIPVIGSSSHAIEAMLTAPTVPGSYGIYATVEHASSGLTGAACGQPFATPPDEATRIATICVK